MKRITDSENVIRRANANLANLICLGNDRGGRPDKLLREIDTEMFQRRAME